MPHSIIRKWFLMASLTDRRRARMVEYFEEENRLLRSTLPRILTETSDEYSRLSKLGKKFVAVINELISNMTPSFFAPWIPSGEVKCRQRLGVLLRHIPP